ncbi:unnamed protein product [Brassicogethes aeneus]|uniref:CCDC92/74 N-terminal domain-containing protein n=1 Tax=Brassicogethes aeneus TaxID=1431903 RepID=A0A9P0BI75_BRAAE|nr:unnamed protein product [Brassicogethes aeneus]
MASKVIAKLPVQPFAQVNGVNKTSLGNVNGEVVAVSRTPELSFKNLDGPKTQEASRVAQLEQNIRFLQEQHQLMLSGLHNEIESLRNRNKELQFQLVFVKGAVPSTPSSPEDESRYKTYNSPKTFNITPLQVELLEKELGDLKLQLQEAESRNVYLSAITDEQKKKLERYERDREKERERACQPDPELLRKLDDAEAIIRRLRRENSDLRRETQAVAQAAQQQQQQFHPHHHHHHNNANGGGGAGGNSGGGEDRSPNPASSRENNGGGGGNYHGNSRGGQGQNRGNHRHHRGHGGGNNHFRGNWFPPLHSQSYWQGGSKNQVPVGDAAALPNLQTPDAATGSACQQPQQYQQPQGRRSHNNNNHHYHSNGESRKHRQNKGGKAS